MKKIKKEGRLMGSYCEDVFDELAEHYFFDFMEQVNEFGAVDRLTGFRDQPWEDAPLSTKSQ